jgi:hAT family C-terminal dimerisation region
LEEACVNTDEPNFDIWQWWRKNSEFYPTLGKMARDFLAVQVSNIASESVFSATGRLSDDTCSLMSEETIKVLLCSKDWFGPKKDVFDLNKFGQFMRRLILN